MLVLLDTSIWVDLFGTRPKYQISTEGWQKVAICPPVVQEVIQGIGDFEVSRRIQDRLLALPCVGNPLPLNLFIQAAEIFSNGRRRGLTIRSSIDCLIATIAIHYQLPMWHRDRDYDTIAKYTALRIFNQKEL